MAKWRYSKGLHDIGNGLYAYLQPDGTWKCTVDMWHNSQ